MKIAMIGQKGIPAHSGGIEQHVDVLAHELTKLGHEVTVYCRKSYLASDPSSSAKTWTHHWPRRIIRPSIPTKHLDAITHTALCSVDVAFRSVDLVHYHAIGPALMSPIPLIFGIPTVVTVHGLDWQRAKWGRLARFGLKLGERTAAHWSKKLVVVSEPLRDYFQQAHRTQAQFIPNGVMPIDLSEPDRINQWKIEPNKYILSASRLVPEKGIHYLIDAYNQLETDYQLVIAGDGGLETGYMDQLKAMAGPGVIFTGNVDRALLGELYGNASLFVLPSELEGMSVALLEAMSCGVPVLVSDIPENSCVVQDSGFLFRNKNVESLRSSLQNLLANTELLPEAGEKASRRANRFQWDQIAKELEAVYRSLTPMNPRSQSDNASSATNIPSRDDSDQPAFSEESFEKVT